MFKRKFFRRSEFGGFFDTFRVCEWPTICQWHKFSKSHL